MLEKKHNTDYRRFEIKWCHWNTARSERKRCHGVHEDNSWWGCVFWWAETRKSDVSALSVCLCTCVCACVFLCVLVPTWLSKQQLSHCLWAASWVFSYALIKSFIRLHQTQNLQVTAILKKQHMQHVWKCFKQTIIKSRNTSMNNV